MLRLRIRAPFAAFRRFTAGAFRPTAPLPAFTTVYGLLLNVAGIESRWDDGISPMTVTAPGLPYCEMSMGLVAAPRVQTLYQQLHNYPVGATGAERVPETKGNKYNIQPIRRELVADLDLRVWVRGNDWLEARARQGIREGTAFAAEKAPRYGIAFLGDNNLILSHLDEEVDEGPPARWLARVRSRPEQAGDILTRLSLWIDRKDMTRTRTELFTLNGAMRMDPPDEAWVAIAPPEGSEVHRDA